VSKEGQSAGPKYRISGSQHIARTVTLTPGRWHPMTHSVGIKGRTTLCQMASSFDSILQHSACRHKSVASYYLTVCTAFMPCHWLARRTRCKIQISKGKENGQDCNNISPIETGKGPTCMPTTKTLTGALHPRQQVPDKGKASKQKQYTQV
jgi:hypothetical protein